MKFDTLIREERASHWEGPLKVGVDLGTANIVIAVVDQDDNPVAGIMKSSKVVRDGIVVDYIGAIEAVREMKHILECRLGCELRNAAAAIPPGVLEGSVKSIANVVEGAGFDVGAIADEPTAASKVLNIAEGAVVDVGGGTTGISILKNGRVIFTGDEPTGGTHMTLVLAGACRCSTEEAEAIKTDAGRDGAVFPVIRPVVDKMASIVKNYLEGYEVDKIYVVGGACCFNDFERAFEKSIGIKTLKPALPLLVTPLGIAMNG
jgi:ethanolamine utilization protein EutJ family protein